MIHLSLFPTSLCIMISQYFDVNYIEGRNYSSYDLRVRTAVSNVAIVFSDCIVIFHQIFVYSLKRKLVGLR